MYDLVITNGMIIDGTGNPWYRGDLAVSSGRIVSIAREIKPDTCREHFDARGLIVCPGFIDTHTHSDYTLLAEPRAISKVHQGVTTEVVGNCGLGMAPLMSREAIEAAEDSARRLHLDLDWRSVGGYLDRLDRTGVSCNVIALVGFGTVRECVMGFSRDPASKDQILQMRSLVEQSIEEGAFGMSSGLFYAPQSYADSTEVSQVVLGLRSKQALYVTHIRDEGNYTVGLEASMQEAFSSAQHTGVALHISHLQANGVAAWGYGPRLVQMVNDMRGMGLDVTADVYPYTRCGGSITGSVMPRWALEGGRQSLLKRLSAKATRARIASEIASTFTHRGGPELHTFSSYAPNPEYEGKTLQEVCIELDETPEHAVLSLLEQDNAAWVAAILNDDDVSSIIGADWAMIGSDGYALAQTGLVSGGKPHPRSFGTFPRVIAEYVKNRRQLSLPDAIRKMTSLPAQRFGLTDRGILKEGFWADIVVLDPDNVRDEATFANPHQLASGISHVIVNGQAVVKDGLHTGLRPGRALRF